VPMVITYLLSFNLPFTSIEVLDVDCIWFERLNLLDLEGLPICIASLVGCNLVNDFWCMGDFEGLIVFLVVTSFLELGLL